MAVEGSRVKERTKTGEDWREGEAGGVEMLKEGETGDQEEEEEERRRGGCQGMRGVRGVRGVGGV